MRQQKSLLFFPFYFPTTYRIQFYTPVIHESLYRGECGAAGNADLCIESLKKAKTQSTYFPRDETGLLCLPTQLERTLQLYW
jgi:hypothetical protein